MFNLYMLKPETMTDENPIMYLSKASLIQGAMTVEANFGSGDIASRGGIGVKDGEKFGVISFFVNPFDKKPGDRFSEEEIAEMAALRHIPPPIRFTFSNKESLEATIANLQSLLKEWDEE